jgi:hypothetical protein
VILILKSNHKSGLPNQSDKIVVRQFFQKFFSKLNRGDIAEYACNIRHFFQLVSYRLCNRIPPESEIDQNESTIKKFLGGCMDQGVELKWFGNKEPVGFTSSYASWKYFGELPYLTNTHRILATMCDMRIPLTFNEKECKLILEIIKEVAKTILK